MCKNESGDIPVVPGHEPGCECYVCEAARSVPEALVPDDFTIHRHRHDPVYVVQFSRHEDDDFTIRVMLDARMMTKIGGMMIEHALDDAAAFMVDEKRDDHE